MKKILISEIIKICKKLDSLYKSKSFANDLYEAYIWAFAYDICKKIDKSTTIYGNSSGLVFRCAPGYIYSNKYSYFEYKSPKSGNLYCGEIGVRFQDVNSILHEYDFSIISKNDRDSCIAAKADPSSRSCKIHVEAKFFSNAISLGIARSMLGLKAACPGAYFHIVTNSNENKSARIFLQKNSITYIHDFLPNSGGITYLENSLKSFLVRI